MVAQANSQTLQTETSTITVQGAIVRVTDAAGNQSRTASARLLPRRRCMPSSGHRAPGYAPITAPRLASQKAIDAIVAGTRGEASASTRAAVKGNDASS